MDQTLKSKHILYVEDDEANQFLMKLLLKRIGCSIDLAGDGQIAVDKVRANRYDIIFMDLRMPVMDGFEATVIIRREIDKTIPIVAVSAYVLKEIVDKCFYVGMNGFIAKGSDMDTMKGEIVSWIEKS
jgi:CheY-like chemotaxis protein